MEPCEIKKPRSCKIFLGLFLAVLAVVAWQGWVFFKTKKVEKEKIEYSVRVEMDKMVDTLGSRLHELSLAVGELSEKLATTKHDESDFEQVFTEQLKKYKDIPSFVCGFEPYAYQPQKRLFGVGWVHKDDAFEKVYVEYDYTLAADKTEVRTDWYTETVKNGARWVDPYWGTALQSHLIAYSVPINSDEDKKLVGVVIGVCRLDELQDIVSTLKIGKSGYSFIVSYKGTYVMHPVKDYYHKNKTMLDIAKDQDNKSLELLADEIMAKKNGVSHFTSEVTKKASTVLFKAIPGTQLILCTVFVENE